MSGAPADAVIVTERLELRPPSLPDFPDCLALWSDPEVVRFITGRPSTREEAWARLLRYAGHWSLQGWGFWTVRERATGRFVGEAGFADFARDADPPIPPPEAGWALATAAQGRGYAAEALSAALAWADRRFAWPVVRCIVSPANARSLRLAEACGFVRERTAVYRGDELAVLARRAPAQPAGGSSAPS